MKLENQPWMSGRTPPPTTIIMKMPLAWAVYLPSPSVARLKILAHMIEVQRPQSTSSRALIGTVADQNLKFIMSNSGMLMVLVLGMNMAARISIMATLVVQSISWRDDTLPAMKPETRRPQSISSQYIAATAPPIMAALATRPAPFSVPSDK